MVTTREKMLKMTQFFPWACILTRMCLATVSSQEKHCSNRKSGHSMATCRIWDSEKRKLANWCKLLHTAVTGVYFAISLQNGLQNVFYKTFKVSFWCFSWMDGL